VNRKEITTQEREQFSVFWSEQRRKIEGRVSEKTMRHFDVFTGKDNIGFGATKLSPGKQGQFDLYFNLITEHIAGCSENEALIASGLTADEVLEEEEKTNFDCEWNTALFESSRLFPVFLEVMGEQKLTPPQT